MRYLIAIIFPPLSVLFTGRLLSALLNVFLTAFFWIPGVVHAIICLNADAAERRHAELMSATTGKAVKPRVSYEKQLSIALVILAAIVLILAALFGLAKKIVPGLDIRSVDEIKADFSPASKPAIEAVKPAPDLPAIGLTFAEITAKHGEPLTKDKASGWASWSTFRARFENGRMSEVEARP